MVYLFLIVFLQFEYFAHSRYPLHKITSHKKSFFYINFDVCCCAIQPQANSAINAITNTLKAKVDVAGACKITLNTAFCVSIEIKTKTETKHRAFGLQVKHIALY